MVTVENHGSRGLVAAFAGRLRRAGTTRNDSARSDEAGFTIAELLVAMVLLGILSTLGTMWLHSLTQRNVHSVTRSTVVDTQLNALSLLARDVNEGSGLLVATPTELRVNVVRNGTCWTRDWKAAGKLTVTTTYYEAADCNGANVVKTEALVSDLTAATIFTYYAADTDLPIADITDMNGVGRIGWTIASLPAGFDQPISHPGSAKWSGRDQSGDGVSRVQATAPILTVVTGTSEGKNPPAMSWSDTNPAGYVASWTLFRSANPEGTTGTDPARSTWQQVGPTFPAAVANFTDGSLPAGYTAQYVLRPTLSDGSNGPTSNQAVTGLRPSVITSLVVTGGNASIKLTWTKRAIGATGYDVYRDGKLAASLGDVDTFTDGPSAYGWVANPADPGNLGYGHTHTYTVTAQNRWESLLTVGSQNGRVSLGDAATFAYPRGGVRLTSNTDGAFTAPAAPTLAVAANLVWNYRLDYIAAGWVGSGPTTKTGQARDLTWNAGVDGGPGAAPSGVWGTQFTGRAVSATSYTTGSSTEAQTASRWRWFRTATCNAFGCSPWSAPQGALQRPSKPASCTATPTGVTTKQELVTITPAAATIPNTGYDVAGGVGADTGAPTNTGVQAVTTRVVDRLADGTTHSFATRSQNGSTANGGYSDITSCSGATDLLTASVPAWSSTTRKVTASFTAGLGTSQSIALSGSAQAGTSGAWDGLADATGYTVTATNTDGDNTVQASVTASTALLTKPSCSVSGGGTAPSGSITVSASGSNGTSQVAAAGSGWYASGTTFGLSNPGTFMGTASATDGANRSSSVNCGTVTVATPAPAAPSCAQDLSYTVFGSSGTAYMNFCSSKYATSYEAKVREANEAGEWQQWVAISQSDIPQPPGGGDTTAGIMRQLNAPVAIAGVSAIQIHVRAVNATGASGWTAQQLSIS